VKDKVHLFLMKYPPPPSPAAELARKLLEAVQARRAQGGDAYPVSLAELNKQTNPAIKPALFRQALAQEEFARAVLRPVAGRTDAPVALAGDRDQLATSPALLEYLVAGSTTSKKPLAPVSHLKHHLIPELQQPFEDSVRRRIAERTLPPAIGVLPGEVPELYLLAEVSIAWVLAQKLLRSLQAQRTDPCPVRLDHLVRQADPGATPELVRKALADKSVKGQLIVAIPGDLESPVIQAKERDEFAARPALLEQVLTGTRTPDSQAVPLPELSKKLDKTLRYTFETTTEQRLDSRSLPAGVGFLRIKKVPYLFFLSELHAAPPAPPQPAPPPVAEKPVPALAFGQRFDEAFDQLNRQRGGHNLVSLVGLRQALGVDRGVFDSELNRLRREGRYTLSAAEGREGITPEERAAALLEHGTLMLYVSRRSGISA
jgi:hypothetical protein